MAMAQPDQARSEDGPFPFFPETNFLAHPISCQVSFRPHFSGASGRRTSRSPSRLLRLGGDAAALRGARGHGAEARRRERGETRLASAAMGRLHFRRVSLTAIALAHFAKGC